MNFPTNDRLLMEADVLSISTFSKSGLRTAIEAGNFPRSVVLSEKRRGWRASDVEKWIAELRDDTDGDTGTDKGAAK